MKKKKEKIKEKVKHLQPQSFENELYVKLSFKN